MKKIILITGLFLLASSVFHLQAQSINNKNWKAFFAEPFNDTLTLHIRSDSSFVTLSNGEVLVQSACKITGDMITITDYSTGQYSCPDVTGKYKINLNGDSLTLALIEDSCEGRAQALNGVKWIKVSK
jgi:hypothetical protein